MAQILAYFFLDPACVFSFPGQSSPFQPSKPRLLLRSMAWYFDGESKASAESSSYARHSLPIKATEYENDISRIFVSLTNTTEDPSGGSGGSGSRVSAGGRGRGGARPGNAAGGSGDAKDEEEEEAEEGSSRGAGALEEYFSSLFDMSFCSHKFKLVG